MIGPGVLQIAMIVVAAGHVTADTIAGGLAELEAAVAVKPARAGSWVAKGQLLARISRHADAIHDFRQAVLLQARSRRAVYPARAPAPPFHFHGRLSLCFMPGSHRTVRHGVSWASSCGTAPRG